MGVGSSELKDAGRHSSHTDVIMRNFDLLYCLANVARRTRIQLVLCFQVTRGSGYSAWTYSLTKYSPGVPGCPGWGPGCLWHPPLA